MRRSTLSGLGIILLWLSRVGFCGVISPFGRAIIRFLGASAPGAFGFRRALGCFDKGRTIRGIAIANHGIKATAIARRSVTSRGLRTRVGSLSVATPRLTAAVSAIATLVIIASTLVAATLLLLSLLLLSLLLLAAGILLALRFAQHAKVMLGMLLKILSRDTVVGQLRVTGKLVVFVDDLLRGAAYLALWAGAVEHAVDDVADRALAVPLGPRPVLR